MVVFSVTPMAFVLLDAAVNQVHPDTACRHRGMDLRRWQELLREERSWEQTGDPQPGIYGSGWAVLFRLLQRSRVAAMCAEAAQAAGAPRAVLMPWLAEREKAILWQRHQRDVQEEIVATMRQHDIDTLILKGTRTAKYYPKPETREFGDLDLYFYNKHREADQVAERELGVAISHDSHHHTKYDYRGVTVESHYDFVNTHYPPSNRGYEAMIKELAPSATFEALFLLRHMACHFAASRITLRELVDWTLTCRALADQADWEKVQQAVVQYGMAPFAAALEEISARQLHGLRVLGLEDTSVKTYLHSVEQDMVLGDMTSLDDEADGVGRLLWKGRRWRALRWHRQLVFKESDARLLLASMTSHGLKPHSILHKM